MPDAPIPLAAPPQCSRHDWPLAGPPFGGIRCDRCGETRPAAQTVTAEELAYLGGVVGLTNGKNGGTLPI